MPIIIEEESKARTQVLRRRQIGETFRGCLIRSERRGRLRKDDRTGEMVPMLKSNGKQAQELVVHLVTLPGTTMNAGLGEDESVPMPGTIVREILKGLSFGAWIDADNALKPRHVGDVLTLTSTVAQIYAGDGSKAGGEITANEEIIAARMKGRNVGIYGPLTLTRATPEDAAYVDMAERAYWEWKNGTATILDPTDADDIFGD